MPTVADVLRRYGGEYLDRFGATIKIVRMTWKETFRQKS